MSANKPMATPLATMAARLDDSEQTPSARVLRELRQQGTTYFQWALAKSRDHKDELMQHPLSPEVETRYCEMAEVSVQDQRNIESSETRSFEEHLESYFSQYRT